MATVTDVLIVASHQPFGEQLVAFVRDQLRCTVTGLATDPTDALDLVRAKRTDVALIDVALPAESGFELAWRLIELYPNARVVLMGDDEPTEYRQATAQLGALAYLPKTEISKRLPEVLGITASGPEPRASRLSLTTSPRSLVLQGVLAGGVLVSGLTLGHPTAALAGAAAVVLLIHWHSARGKRPTLVATNAPAAALATGAPTDLRQFRPDGVRGSPEQGAQFAD